MDYIRNIFAGMEGFFRGVLKVFIVIAVIIAVTEILHYWLVIKRVQWPCPTPPAVTRRVEEVTIKHVYTPAPAPTPKKEEEKVEAPAPSREEIAYDKGYQRELKRQQREREKIEFERGRIDASRHGNGYYGGYRRY